MEIDVTYGGFLSHRSTPNHKSVHHFSKSNLGRPVIGNLHPLGKPPPWNLSAFRSTIGTSERLPPRLEDRPGPSSVGRNGAVAEEAAGAHANVPRKAMAVGICGESQDFPVKIWVKVSEVYGDFTSFWPFSEEQKFFDGFSSVDSHQFRYHTIFLRICWVAGFLGIKKLVPLVRAAQRFSSKTICVSN